ncbi:MAG: hypothetical protein V4615_11965 [Bacteroidota bacterium]
MKRLLSFCLILNIAALSLTAQNLSSDKIPPSVLMAYKTWCPGPEFTRWYILADSTYGVFYTLQDVKHFAQWNKEGSWIQHKVNCESKALPDLVKTAAAAQFLGFEPQHVLLIDSANTEPVYEIFMMKGKEFYITRVSLKGEILRTSEKNYWHNLTKAERNQSTREEEKKR